MTWPLLPEWSDLDTAVIGMVHLQPLPGSVRYQSDPGRVEAAMLRDVEALAAGHVHGLLMENFGDVPFHPGRVPTAVVSHMTALGTVLRRRFAELPLGINVLRNDGCAALAIAHAVGARFIRVNVLCGARVTDQGVLQGIAHELLLLRAQLGAEDIRIFADVNVKHSARLANISLEDEVADTIDRGGADAVIVSGSRTGMAADLVEVEKARAVAGRTPVLVGSGVTSESIVSYASAAAGLIVGTSIKRDGIASYPVDRQRVEALTGRL